MKTLSRNKTSFYYATFKTKTAATDSNGDLTGEYTITYNSPVKAYAYITAARGQADAELFGINTNYSKTIVTDDMTCPIKEDSVLWIGKEAYDNNTLTAYNYVVVQVAKSFNHITYAIREVNINA